MIGIGDTLKQGRYLLGLLVIVVLGIFGCGGSSSSSSSLMDVFITDNLTTDYSSVWVKVYKVELKDTAGNSAKVLESTEGVPVNLRQLNDGASRFLLLAPNRVPDGTYNKIEFYVDRTVNLVATGTGAASTAQFPASLNATTPGQSELDLTLSPAITVPGTNRLTVDFDLSTWTVTSGIITPVLRVHPGNGLDDSNRHERFEFKGLVSELGGIPGAQTFTLNLRFGGQVNVLIDDATDVVGSALANGKKVEVYGTLNPATRTILAKVIKVDNEFENEAKAIGPFSDPNESAGTLKIMPKFTRGFTLNGEKLNVTTAGTVKYKGRHGALLTKAQFFAALASNANAFVQVEGAFTSATNTIAAKSLHVENEPGFGEAEGKGQTSNPNAETNRFKLSLTEAIGFTAPEGPMTVFMIPGATFKDDNTDISRAAFFELLAQGGKVVDVKGSFTDGVFSARRARIRR
jgi:hypothetical protein